MAVNWNQVVVVVYSHMLQGSMLGGVLDFNMRGRGLGCFLGSRNPSTFAIHPKP